MFDSEEYSKEKAQLAFDIQDLYIEFWYSSDKEKPAARDFFDFLLEEKEIYYKEAADMIYESFGSYNDLLRSLGEIPNQDRNPQDEAERIFRSDVELPITYTELIESGYHSMANISGKLGSYAGMMEAFGVFDEHLEMIKPFRNRHTKRAEEMNREDKRSLIELIESETGKDYEELSIKYET